MRAYLLDTHIFIWLVSDRDRIPKEVKSELDDVRNQLYLSAASFWEIEMNRGRGRMHFSGEVGPALSRLGIVEMPVKGEHFRLAATLPWHHKDPFDRIFVAQAQWEGLVLVTHDRMLAAYNVPMLRV